MPEHIYIRLFQMLVEELERVEYRITQNAVDKDKAIQMFFELSDNAINMGERMTQSIRDNKQRIEEFISPKNRNR
jgi:hypothetical protein